MSLLLITSSSGTTPSENTSLFKDFRELSIASWKEPNQENEDTNPPQKSESNGLYTITQASRYLGKTEEWLRLFLWDSHLLPDAGTDQEPLFSEQFLDLISSYGYLFDYAKIWSKTGHHDQAANLCKEAELVFGISSQTEQKSYFLSGSSSSDADSNALKGNLGIQIGK